MCETQEELKEISIGEYDGEDVSDYIESIDIEEDEILEDYSINKEQE